MNIWEKTTVDDKGKCVTPKTIRDYIGIRQGYKILWIAADKKKSNTTTQEYQFTVAIIEKKE